MAVVLEGGCRVLPLREGEPQVEGSLKLWPRIGRAVGTKSISLRTLEFGAGTSPGLRNHHPCEETLFVLEGEATVHLDGFAREVCPDTGIFLAPGVTLAIVNQRPDQPLVVVSSRCPEPDGPGLTEPCLAPASGATVPDPFPVVRLADRKRETTADRWYRELVNHTVGCKLVTQFMGAIPPGRAPDHFHEYEEVLCILQGTGRMWAGETSAPVEPGSLVYLPRRQVHCMENTGDGELRLLGAFYPAGSPAEAYEA